MLNGCPAHLPRCVSICFVLSDCFGVVLTASLCCSQLLVFLECCSLPCCVAHCSSLSHCSMISFSLTLLWVSGREESCRDGNRDAQGQAAGQGDDCASTSLPTTALDHCCSDCALTCTSVVFGLPAFILYIGFHCNRLHLWLVYPVSTDQFCCVLLCHWLLLMLLLLLLKQQLSSAV